MKYILLFIMSISVLAGEGSHTGNGGGSSEANIIYAWENLEKFIAIALKSKTIELEKQDRELLLKIQKNMDEERKELNIIFKSGREYPELFELDGQGLARIAVTGDFIGDKIYFNYDRLYPNDEFGTPQPISVLRAVGYLIHELGHHHKIKDHAYLDQLGAKVMMSTRGMIKRVDLSEYEHPFIDVTAYNKYLNFVDVILSRNTFNSTPMLSDLILADSEKLINLSESLNKGLFCDPLNSPLLKSSYFSNLHWGELEAYNENTKQQKITLKGNLNWACISKRSFLGQNFRVNSSFEMDLYFKVIATQESGGIIFDDSERTWPRRREHKLIFLGVNTKLVKCSYENNYGLTGECIDLPFAR